MKIQEIKAFEVKGLSIRTDNQSVEEIIGLWGRIGNLNEEIYAVYSNYESDHHGKYDLLVGSLTNEFIEKVMINTGKYLVITVEKGTPDEIGAAWQKIWQDEAIYQKRLFTTDFEHYLADGSARIYLAIK